MNMTNAQRRAIQRLTNRIEQYYGRSQTMKDDPEFMKYTVTKGYAKAVILQATNTGAPWYCSHKCATIIIGERGGIQRKISMFDNMKTSLIID